MSILRYLFAIFAACINLSSLQAIQLVSTESDPDAFIHDSVNIINGDYCESATDLVIAGPDTLILQRFYSTKDLITGTQKGGWRILPQRFLIMGKDPLDKSCMMGKERFEGILAFAGERSGGILPYSGWLNASGLSKNPLNIDILNNALGMVNTYAKEINGQNNHQNNLIECKGTTCELTLGDGTKRIFKQVPVLPSLLLGEELIPLMAAQVIEPRYFLLIQEILPSGNQLFFSYDKECHLTGIEMKNKTCNKTLSWVHLSYHFEKNGCQVQFETSDVKKLIYHFNLEQNHYQLAKVEGSHCIPISYKYDEALVKKILPEGRFMEIEYINGKVKTLKRPNSCSGKAEIAYSFSYGNDNSDVFNAAGVRTRYLYDKRYQLISIERYDAQNHLYRVEKKYWGKRRSDAGFLLAKTIGNGNGHIYSYRSFNYDKSGNIIEEKLYGNLTGKQEVSLQVSSDGQLINSGEECHIKKFDYSPDGLNLLTKIGDCKGNQTLYSYKPGTNLLVKKLIFDGVQIKKRTFQSYNEDGSLVKTIEDDGSQDQESKIYGWCVTERHITEITPKQAFPGVGLPEIIEVKALDLKNKREVLIKKLVNIYDDQSNLLSCTTYDANGQYAFAEKKSYNVLGQVISEIDATGKELLYSYDDLGNQISLSIPSAGKFIETTYDFQNQPIQMSETNAEGLFITSNIFDLLNRKTSSTDRFGNSTYYEYDDFHRLTKIIYPEVLDEKGELIRPTFSYTYDIFGNVLTIQDPKRSITEKSYNLRGDPTEIRYPDGSFERFKYDPEGSLHRSLTRKKIITVYEYDYLGRLIHEENTAPEESKVTSFITHKSYQYNGFHCTYEKDDKLIRRYRFDPAGRLSIVIEHANGEDEKSPESRITEFFYDSLSRVHQKRIWFDCGPSDYTLECFAYDLYGNVVEKRIEDAKKNVLLRKGFSYDSQRQCIEEYSLKDGVKNTLTRTSYNSQGDPIAYFDALKHETKIMINYSYQNEIGQTVLKKTIVNPVGIQTEIEFDALSRVRSIFKKDPFGVILSSQKIIYDALGNKACEIHDRIVSGKVIGTQRTEWMYGPMGRLEEEVEAAGSSLEKRVRYSYNELGQMTSKTISGMGEAIQYFYNREGRLHQIEAKGSKKKELHVYNKYFYDYKGNIVSAYALEKSVRRTYNAFNQVTKETIDDGEGSYTLKYAYDRKGRLKEIVLPDLSKILYTYDAVFGRQVKRISQGNVLYSHTYNEYDDQGRLVREERIGNLGNSEYTYDPNGQKITSKNDSINQECSRDSLGHLLSVKGSREEEYAYNALSQLIEEKQVGVKYTYDSLDNRMQLDNDELVHNALNQITFCSKGQFLYDPQGNLLRKVLDSEETRFENNILSQLISIEKADTTAITFAYDPFGRLLVEKHLDLKDKSKKIISTSRYFYLGYQEIGTLAQNGAVETLKIPGLQGDELATTSIAFEIKGECYAPLHDFSGNVICLIDPHSRELIERYEYTAFGKETIYNSQGVEEHDSTVSNPWRFAEKRLDQKSGFIFFGLRFFDPAIGRWVSQDPAGYIDGPNLYTYLHNNPLNYLDRYGLAAEKNSQNKFIQYFVGEFETHCYCERHRTCKRGGDIGKTAGSSLPKITYCDHFEECHSNYKSEEEFWATQHLYDDFRPYYEPSKTYDLSDQGLSEVPDMEIGFINGIDTSFQEAIASATYISRLAGGYNVHAVYNATHGKTVDLRECDMGLNFIATEPVRQLHKMWNSFFERSSAKAKFLMICHSQGAIHVRNALLDYPPELRERILVVAIAPGGYIYRETCANVIHYRAEWWRDFVPRWDSAGAIREKDTIVNLTSHQDAPTFDHDFMSPTYQKELRKHIANYIKTEGKML